VYFDVNLEKTSWTWVVRWSHWNSSKWAINYGYE